MKKYLPAAAGTVVGLAAALLLYRWPALFVLMGGADTIYAVTPQHCYYAIPENGTIRYGHGGTCSCLGYVERDGGRLRLVPGQRDSIFGSFSYSREIDGQHLIYQLGDYEFAIHYDSRFPRDATRASWRRRGGGSIAVDELAIQALAGYVRTGRQTVPDVELKIVPQE